MKDLTNLKTYIIDSDYPHEVDDAISFEIKEGNIKNLWIHISNPSKLFLHDSNVDLNARKRNSSLYLIDQYVPMLPEDILEKANLAQNKISETISAAIEFNDDGSINNYELTEAIIKPKYQLTYEDVNEILESCKKSLHGLLICIHKFFLFPSFISNEIASSTSCGSSESIIYVFKLVKSFKYLKY